MEKVAGASLLSFAQVGKSRRPRAFLNVLRRHFDEVNAMQRSGPAQGRVRQTLCISWFYCSRF